MTHPDHEEYAGLAVGWALHALEPGEKHAFADHLSTCDLCRQIVQESEETMGELAHDVPLVDPPAGLLDRIHEAMGVNETRAQAESPAESIVRPVTAIQRRRVLTWAAPAMAAALVLVALLGWNVSLRDRATTDHRLAAQRQTVINELAQSSTRAALKDSSNRTVGYVLERDSQVKVVSTGLTPNDRSKSTYVLWAVRRSGEPPRPVGTFDVLGSSLDIRPVDGLSATLDGYTGFEVSREPGRSVPVRPTQVVATGSVRA